MTSSQILLYVRLQNRARLKPCTILAYAITMGTKAIKKTAEVFKWFFKDAEQVYATQFMRGTCINQKMELKKTKLKSQSDIIKRLDMSWQKHNTCLPLAVMTLKL